MAIRAALEDALYRAQEIARSARAALWQCEGFEDLVPLMVLGDSPADTLASAKVAVRLRTFIVTDHETCTLTSLSSQDSRVFSGVGTGSENRLIGMNVLDANASMQVRAKKRDDTLTEVCVCCVPLINTDGLVIGVLDVAGPHRLASEEIKLLGVVAAFAAVVVDRSPLEALRNFADQENELQEYISLPERSSINEIPALLAFTGDRPIFDAGFDSSMWDRIGYLKILFAIFAAFRLQQTCKIENEKLYRCFTALREAHNPIPCHDWRHAVDVAQFIAFQINVAGLDKIFTALEIAAVIMAALCRDANHAGFAKVGNERAELPLGILLSKQSVSEARHCAAAIGAISRQPCNLFSALVSTDFAWIWATITQLITATDIWKHFDWLKKMNELLEGKFDMTHPEHRLVALELILKCGIVSDIARPFDLAGQSRSALCEEFFRHGDLAVAAGMHFTSPGNNRAHLDKGKSRLGFCKSVCLPLFQIAASLSFRESVNVSFKS
jgi:hypothetical protein